MLTKIIWRNNVNETIDLIESDSVKWTDGKGDLILMFSRDGRESERFVFSELSGRVDIYIMENGKTVDTILFGKTLTEGK